VLGLGRVTLPFGQTATHFGLSSKVAACIEDLWLERNWDGCNSLEKSIHTWTIMDKVTDAVFWPVLLCREIEKFMQLLHFFLKIIFMSQMNVLLCSNI